MELSQNETLIEEIKGDYWEKIFLCMYSQKRGKYWITNERIVFKGGFITEFEVKLSEIESVTPCLVGPLIPFMPTGVNLKLKNGKSYKMSVLKRKKIIETIKNLI